LKQCLRKSVRTSPSYTSGEPLRSRGGMDFGAKQCPMRLPCSSRMGWNIYNVAFDSYLWTERLLLWVGGVHENRFYCPNHTGCKKESEKKVRHNSGVFLFLLVFQPLHNRLPLKHQLCITCNISFSMHALIRPRLFSTTARVVIERSAHCPILVRLA
jgi:hypothetical protein